MPQSERLNNDYATLNPIAVSNSLYDTKIIKDAGPVDSQPQYGSVLQGSNNGIINKTDNDFFVQSLADVKLPPLNKKSLVLKDTDEDDAGSKKREPMKSIKNSSRRNMKRLSIHSSHTS